MAQDNFSQLAEQKIKVGYHVTERYSHTFAFENRTRFYKDDLWGFDALHMEFSHVSDYEYRPGYSIGLGLQYRFRKNFYASKEDELRTTQQLEWQKAKTTFSMTHRLRNEQRFYATYTNFRVRYKLGLKFKTSEKSANFLKTETEFLLELGKTQKPELEQRLSVLYGMALFPKADIEFGLQYRLSDYSQDLSHELFAVLELALKL